MRSQRGARPLWRCPDCGREFANRNQWHSCVSVPVESHFEGRPAFLYDLFDDLVKMMEEHGPVRMDAVPSSINLGARAHFAGVRVATDHLRVEFILDRTLEDPRITRSEHVGKNIYAHYAKVSAKRNLDDQLLGWLAEAYRLRS